MRKFTTLFVAIVAIVMSSTTVLSADLLNVVRVNGLAEIGQTALQDNRAYSVTYPTTVSTRELSSMTALLPNGHGVFIKANTTLSIDNESREQTPFGVSWIGLLYLTVKRGDFAVCSPEKSAVNTYMKVSTRGAVILGSDRSTYVVIGDQLTVTRGSVDVLMTDKPNKHVIVQDGESVILSSPLTIGDAKKSGGLSEAVLEAAVEACSARMTIPSAVAEPVVGPKTNTPFPIQPINPDIVSPAS